MEQDYLSFFYEINYPIKFYFNQEEINLFDPPQKDDIHHEPIFMGTDFVLRCTAEINKILYTQNEYNQHIKHLSELSIKGIDKETIKLSSRQVFLNNINERIQKSKDLFKTETFGLVKNLNDTFRSGKINLSEDQVKEEKYLKLYQPFYKIQFDTLMTYNETFRKMFVPEISLRTSKKPSQIEFKYSNLYYNTKFHRDVKEQIEDLVQKLREGKYITNKTINPFIYYFGLTKSPSKILWVGDIGDFYTFYRRLKVKKIVIGHDKRTLPNHVEGKFSDWEHWNSMKHTHNQKHIEGFIDAFIKKLEELNSKNSA